MLLILKVTFLNLCYLLQTQLSPASKGAYRDYLGKLDLQYGKLLVIFFPLKSPFHPIFLLVCDINAAKLLKNHMESAVFFVCFSELFQIPPAKLGFTPRLRQRCHEGTDVAERQRRGGGQLRLERQEH